MSRSTSHDLAGTDLRPTIRVLLLDDDPDDAVLTEMMLEDSNGQEFVLEWIPNYEQALEVAKQNCHDVLLVDFQLGSVSGLDVLRIAKDLGLQLPIIMLTGQDTSQTDLEAMRLGAVDYLVKGDLSPALLSRSIRYAVERNVSEKKLLQLAQTDDLTGVSNRPMFLQHLENAILRADQEETKVCLYFIDLDRFKNINDTLGHKVGDKLLQCVAERLIGAVRRDDVVARLGGDEFTIISGGVRTSEAAAKIAQKILKTLSTPFQIENREVSVTASVGISIYPDHACEVDELIRNADMAMYRAKDAGRNECCFHSTEMTKQAVRRMTIESRLQSALENGELFLNYQPQVNLQTNKVVGVEALARWQEPELGLIPPSDFISIAEEAKLISPIGEWVMETACAQAAAWHEAGFPDLQIAINLSARQFHDQALVKRLSDTIDRTGINPRLIEIELTEGHLAHDTDLALQTLNQFKEMGICIAIDDFGTGYSSLSHLTRLPVDTLKIDQSFVSNMTCNSSDAAVARAIINLGDGLGLTVVAEGVETQGQIEILKASKCMIAQGFKIARPMSASVTSLWLHSFEREHGPSRERGSNMDAQHTEHANHQSALPRSALPTQYPLSQLTGHLRA